ncbi:MAG TPA: NAD(P)-dependent oxidoreductase [Candidatus Eremiobacteraeota bacterium]|nr:MAG: D-3-phosphoglycerate dehydrogenase [bacterium ADurb.Bin363]HPZ07942.1 NAD(P)-dependent oxidoreductase [Candidatus Eremiobacteraeota bacterium]
MKVLICDSMDKQSLAKLQEHSGLQVDVKVGMKPDELLSVIPDYHVMVVRSATKVTADVINAAKNLKLVVRGGVGVDNIDVVTAEKVGVKVANTPAASSISVAELAIAMMFALSKKLTYLDSSMKQGKWVKKGYQAMELYGKTIGIIGLGRIGQEVAKRALGLGMQVHFQSMRAIINFESKGCGTEQHPMKTMLEKSDFITLHTPFIKEHGAILKAEHFAKMKDGVFIINCARGGVIDEVALMEALKSGKVAGAALDVFETEPNYREEFRQFENVILTPHIGAATKEAQSRVGEEVVKIIFEFFDSSK